MTECLISPFKTVSEITELCLELLGACLVQHFDFVLGGGVTTLTNSAARCASDHAPLRRSKIRKIRDGAAFLPNSPPEIHEES
jgi:hypothetical protein